MSKRQLRILRGAARDMLDARLWYNERSVGLGDDFLKEVDVALQKLQENPGLWPPYLHGTRRVLLSRFPYYVVYRAPGELIEVLAVAHGKRKPGYWRRRKQGVEAGK